jgi:hypothetical protein
MQSGDTLTLNVSSWQAVWQSDGRALTIMNYEDESGHILAVPLVAATASDYNRAVDALRQSL